MHKMMERSGTLFRDPEDVEQATRFLHENGKIFSLHKNYNHYYMGYNILYYIYITWESYLF